MKILYPLEMIIVIGLKGFSCFEPIFVFLFVYSSAMLFMFLKCIICASATNKIVLTKKNQLKYIFQVEKGYLK